MAKIYDYFLGSTNPDGFVSFFEQLLDLSAPFRTYIIKSGPGCGKSSMMKRMANRISQAGFDLELIHCSSDPDSLDGVVCRQLHFAIADGTSPHVLEPSLPACKQEVVSLYDCIDSAQLTAGFLFLRENYEIYCENHIRAKRYACAFGKLFVDLRDTSSRYVETTKLHRYAENLAARTMPKKCCAGFESVRLSGAITPLCYIDYTKSNLDSLENVYILNDRYTSAGHMLMKLLRDRARLAGYDIVTSRNPFCPIEIDSVLIPELSLAFATAGFFDPLYVSGAHTIGEKTVYSSDLELCRKRLSFMQRASHELLNESGKYLAQAKAMHDKMESVYSANINFDLVREREARLLSELGL
ncbi:MAG: hypothetical protein RR058_01415 [Oscillospiraceae bacterium]